MLLKDGQLNLLSPNGAPIRPAALCAAFRLLLSKTEKTGSQIINLGYWAVAHFAQTLRKKRPMLTPRPRVGARAWRVVGYYSRAALILSAALSAAFCRVSLVRCE